MLIIRKEFWLAVLSFAVAGSLSMPVQAGVISQYTEVSTYQRSCPGLADPQFAENWGNAIRAVYGVSSFGTDIACHFNAVYQQRFYNPDGSAKNAALPPGVPFTPADVAGGSYSALYSAASEATLGTAGDDFYGMVRLDSDNLGLPEIKIKASSATLQRNSVNGFAATQYQWLGAATTLSYSVDFDFYNSRAVWSMSGAEAVHDYAFGLTFGVSQGMQLSYELPFDFNFGHVLNTAEFLSSTVAMIESDAENPYQNSLTLSFVVNPGDKFWLWTQVQAFGINGGFVDASHTVTSGLGVEGLSQAESLRLFSTDLRQVPNQIPQPATLLLVLIAVGLFKLRRR